MVTYANIDPGDPTPPILPYSATIDSPVDANGFVQTTDATQHDPENDQFSVGVKTTNGATPFHLVSAGSNNATSVKATAGRVYGLIHLVNTSTTYAIRVKFYDKASAPNPASDTVKYAFTLPAAASSTQPTVLMASGNDVGMQFSVGIAFAVVKGQGDTDNTPVLAGDAEVNFTYS